MLGRRTGGLADGRTDVSLSAAKGLKPGIATAITSTLRQLAGMPDYRRHIEHLRRCHPERPTPTERQYFEEYLEGRYQDGPTRCC